MKVATYVFFFFFFFLAAGVALGKTPWEVYLSNPTPNNASKVTRIEYTPGAIPKDYGYWAPDLDILQNQVLAGDVEAFRLAYRLLQKADGGLAEDLTMILSHTIRVRPAFFLRELSMLQPNARSLESILLMPGLEYVDRSEAQRYEIDMRIKAIESVSDETLKSYRDKCLQILRKK